MAKIFSGPLSGRVFKIKNFSECSLSVNPVDFTYLQDFLPNLQNVFLENDTEDAIDDCVVESLTSSRLNKINVLGLLSFPRSRAIEKLFDAKAESLTEFIWRSSIGLDDILLVGNRCVNLTKLTLLNVVPDRNPEVLNVNELRRQRRFPKLKDLYLSVCEGWNASLILPLLVMTAFILESLRVVDAIRYSGSEIGQRHRRTQVLDGVFTTILNHNELKFLREILIGASGIQISTRMVRQLCYGCDCLRKMEIPKLDLMGGEDDFESLKLELYHQNYDIQFI